MFDRSTREIVADLVAAGFTQTEIADGCGLTQPTISRIAGGLHKNPGVDTHKRIASFANKNLRRRKQALLEAAGR